MYKETRSSSIIFEGHHNHRCSKTLYISVIVSLILVVLVYYHQNSQRFRFSHSDIIEQKPNEVLPQSNSIAHLVPPLQHAPYSVLSAIEFINSPFLEFEPDLSNVIPVIVLSRAANIEIRDAIRRTWAFDQLYRNDTIQVKVFFLVGIDDYMLKRIYTEQNLFSDVIQVSVAETDSFISYKELSAMMWVRSYFPNTPFYIKTEDKVILNMKSIIDLLLPIIEPIRNENLIIGWFGLDYSVARGSYQKFINAVLPPSYVDLYYAMSLLYIVTSKASDRMIEALSHVELIEHPGDPFVTGILREAAHVQIKNLAESMKKFKYEIVDQTCKEAFKKNSKLLFCTSSLLDAPNRAILEYFDAWQILLN